MEAGTPPRTTGWLALDPERWREDLLRIVLRVTAVLGGAVCVPSVWLSVVEGLYPVAVLDTVALSVILSLVWFDRAIPPRVRAALACLVFYVLGAGLLVGVGSISQIYLYGFSLLTTLLLGFREGMASTVVNAVTLLAIGWAGIAGPDMVVPHWAFSFVSWALITSNFALVNVSLVLALGAVISALEAALRRALEEIAAREEAESRQSRLEEHLRQSQKLEAIGLLAGGIAHDFNNLLSVVMSYSELLIADLPPDSPRTADLNEIRKAGLRAGELTRQLLAFGRKQRLQPVVLDLGSVVRGVERMLIRLLGPDVQLKLALSDGELSVHADAGQLEQVLLNLVANARDAMPFGGTVTIGTGTVSLGIAEAEALAVPARDYARLTVTDTGVGMDDETRSRIFEPFFTTKDKSRGSGLGLSSVYGIVEQSGGRIRVLSALGAGTTFEILLPLSEQPASPAPAAEAAKGPAPGCETVLVVEDEDAVRAVVASILRRQGYRVHTASGGSEALALADTLPELDLLLSDVVMPEMSGPDVAEALCSRRPGIAVLFMSGYAEASIVAKLGTRGDVLPKPIANAALLQRVRAALDARKSKGAVGA